jgi:hypothetical protein
MPLAICRLTRLTSNKAVYVIRSISRGNNLLGLVHRQRTDFVNRDDVGEAQEIVSGGQRKGVFLEHPFCEQEQGYRRSSQEECDHEGISGRYKVGKEFTKYLSLQNGLVSRPQKSMTERTTQNII